jgi:hypothetical protein
MSGPVRGVHIEMALKYATEAPIMELPKKNNFFSRKDDAMNKTMVITRE